MLKNMMIRERGLGLGMGLGPGRIPTGQGHAREVWQDQRSWEGAGGEEHEEVEMEEEENDGERLD